MVLVEAQARMSQAFRQVATEMTPCSERLPHMVAAAGAQYKGQDFLGHRVVVVVKIRRLRVEMPHKATVVEMDGRQPVAHQPAVVAVQGVLGFRARQRSVLPRFRMAATEVLAFRARLPEWFPISLAAVAVGQITIRTPPPSAVGAEALETTPMAREMARTPTEAWEQQREPTPAVAAVVVTTRGPAVLVDLGSSFSDTSSQRTLRVRR